jgi:hypothetical protein
MKNNVFRTLRTSDNVHQQRLNMLVETAMQADKFTEYEETSTHCVTTLCELFQRAWKRICTEWGLNFFYIGLNNLIPVSQKEHYVSPT